MEKEEEDEKAKQHRKRNREMGRWRKKRKRRRGEEEEFRIGKVSRGGEELHLRKRWRWLTEEGQKKRGGGR